METKWAKKRDRRAKLDAAIKSARIPALTVVGVFLTALVLIPLAFSGVSAAAGDTLEIDAPVYTPSTAMPLPTPAAPEETPEPTQEPLETPAGTQDAAIYEPLQFGDETATVALMQQRLMDLLYMESDEPTEYYGPATQDAIIRFQRAHYMKETGVADAQTQAVLFSDSAKEYVLEKGSSGEDVLSIQKRLNELGYYGEKLNGYFGTATGRAISAFQTKNKLGVTGAADLDTRELIYSPDARPAVDPTPTPSPTPTKKPRVTATPKPTGSSTRTTAPQTAGGGWNEPAGGSDGSGGGGDTPVYTQTPITVNGSVSDFIAAAKQQIGKPYVLGAEGPSAFDCSGLVYYCLRAVGVKVGRYSANSFANIDSWTTVYGKENMQPGDLIFYKSNGSSSTHVTHVAIWLGGGSLLHASTSRGQVCTTTWGSWSDNNFLFAKRVFD